MGVGATQAAPKSKYFDDTFDDPAWSVEPVDTIDPWYSADQELAKAMYLEVKKEGRLTSDWLPYGFRGHYKVIHKTTLQQNIFGAFSATYKSMDFVRFKLNAFESNCYCPVDLFTLLVQAKWIVETRVYSKHTWYRAG